MKITSLKKPECATNKEQLSNQLINQSGSPKQNELTVNSSKTTKLKTVM